jgi:hypothetical protein
VLIERCAPAPCIWLDLAMDGRVSLLMREYDFFVRDVAAFCAVSTPCGFMRGHETVNDWQEAARKRADRSRSCVTCCVSHYDPILPAVDRLQLPGTQDAGANRLGRQRRRRCGGRAEAATAVPLKAPDIQ